MSDEKLPTELTAEQQDWLRYWKEVRAAAEPFEKRAVEYHKAGVEFSKLLVTNLFVLNAGGLVSLPALSVFLGVSTLPAPERSFVLGWAATAFGVGLFWAAVCALATYLNYHAFVDSTVAERNRAVLDVGRLLRKLGDDQKKLSAERADLDEEIRNQNKRINIRYYVGHICGWLSLCSFGAGAIWLATQLK